jgi:hypothetical protein
MMAQQNAMMGGGYAYPSQPMPYGQPPIVISTTTATTYESPKGPDPVMNTCRGCKYAGMTNVEEDDGQQWMLFWCLFAFGFFTGVTWFFSCVPFCMDSLKNYRHRCAACNNIA